ncbi:stage IV sporulation YqfD [human gut metagenome]|uniref:Stage IV sporulation YqfD n=1 Tax=human gut metagenome TaxID=408170 RepID=K1TAZ1_9ZZZZ
MTNRYRIKITGKDPKYFLRHLIVKKIKLYNIIEDHDGISLTVDEVDYAKILKMKTSYNIQIINRFGVAKLRYLFLKYKYILSFLFLTLGLMIILSHFIFFIDVIHSKEEIRELVENDLKEFGISKYRFRVSYAKKEEIRNKILEKEKDKIEWLEIDRIGTRYIVNVEERLIKDNKVDNEVRDIVAKKDAMILNIEAETGEIVRKKYEYVRKGDTIVSGTIKNKEDEVSKVKAEGKVYGEVWYSVTVELPKKYYEEKKTGKTSKALTLRIANKKISVPFSKDNKSYISEDSPILENNLIPIKLVLETKHEIEIIDKEYNMDNSSSEAIKLATKKLEDRLDEQSMILSKKVLKKTLKNSKIIVEIFFKVRENITDYKKISKELKIEGD